MVRGGLELLEMAAGAGTRPGELRCAVPGARPEQRRGRREDGAALAHPPVPPSPSRMWHWAKWIFNRAYWVTVPQGRIG